MPGCPVNSSSEGFDAPEGRGPFKRGGALTSLSGQLVLGELRLVGRVERVFLDDEAVFLRQSAHF